MSIAVSGLRLQENRVAVAADNIANVRSGADAPQSGEEYQGYVPKTAEGVSQVGGGVTTAVRDVRPSYVLAPGTQMTAQSQALPNVDLAGEAATMMQAEQAYKANASVIKTAEEMQRELLDITG